VQLELVLLAWGLKKRKEKLGELLAPRMKMKPGWSSSPASIFGILR